MGLYSKNLVCTHCINMLQSELKNLGLEYNEIGLGLMEIDEENTNMAKQFKLNKIIKNYGLKLVPDHKSIMITKIKNLIKDLINNPGENEKFVLSTYISEKLNYDYTYLYNLFSSGTGQSIKYYYMMQKVERVKYLLVYEQLPVTEITYMLNYSSVAHLSNQFKKITGLTPSEFKNLKNKRFLQPKGKTDMVVKYA
jgi:AraC-like DNA-binding protein